MSNEELELLMLKHASSISSQKSFAKEIGFSVGKINYVLNALIDKGLIKSENFLTSQNKRKYKYLLTDKGIEKKIFLTRKFIEKKKAEYEELQRDLEIDMMKQGVN
ncbi:MAG: MarR family EPS-associated transcriptional regulator [Campylobacterota bacterium]|nr:MarR family EPS-associated transcriptional regulator [Campylobacterota bacterium]